MKLTVFHLKTCDTCRKAIKALEAAGHELSLIDVRADGVHKTVLETLVANLGWEVALNRRSTTWRGLPDSDKSDVTDAKAVTLMMEHPTLIKRPVIMSDNQTTIGWAKDVPGVWT